MLFTAMQVSASFAAVGTAGDDPTTTPQPLSLYVFLFLAAALTLLFVSMIGHMRRARRNLGTPDPGSPPAAQPGSTPPEGQR